MRSAHLDTNVVVWLFDRRHDRLTKPARRALDRAPAIVSPAVRLELHVLRERGRLKVEADEILARLAHDQGLVLVDTRFDAVIERATRFAWTRDPFDRLIVANAMADGCELVTADEHIRAHFAGAIW